MTWQSALDYVACLNANNYLGHNDWRLPNINELESLVNEGQGDQSVWLNGQGFINTALGSWAGSWASTTVAGSPSNAWIVAFEGRVGYAGKSLPDWYAWCVRGDTTPPNIDVIGCPLKVNLNTLVSVTVTVTDSESGVAYQSAPNGNNVLDTSGVGTKTFTVTARDNRGNTGSNSCIYQVVYDFSGAGGFQPPVDDPPITNTAKAGSTIPVKWQLPNGSGGFISDLGAVISIKAQQVACSNFSSTLTDPVDTTAAGNTVLRYDLTSNQYIYNWKTSKTQAGKCYILNLTLNDGMSYQADFSLK
jgi:hypothetical protein